MFKSRNSVDNKNITYPKHFSTYLSPQIDKRKDKKLKKTHAYQLCPTHSLENKTCPWIRVL